MHLEDKVVVITGATRGIGKAFAVDILEKGAKVCICYAFVIYLFDIILLDIVTQFKYISIQLLIIA